MDCTGYSVVEWNEMRIVRHGVSIEDNGLIKGMPKERGTRSENASNRRSDRPAGMANEMGQPRVAS